MCTGYIMYKFEHVQISMCAIIVVRSTTMWAELGHDHFSLKYWVKLHVSHFQLCNSRMGAKNDFQRKLLFRDKFSDYEITKECLYPGVLPIVSSLHHFFIF